jgi:pyruvate dehydrogenase E2 component (dihydrolipoamide acetyltransferase)
MADVIRMLALSPTMEEGTVSSWVKQEGDVVEEGDVIAEVETDKATMEMTSFYSGRILKIVAQAGQPIKVGAAMAVIGEPGEDADAALAAFGGKGAAPAAAAPAASAASAAAQAPVEAPKVEAVAVPVGRLVASPLARRIAEEHGLALGGVQGSGPGGRIVKSDVEAALAAKPVAAAPAAAVAAVVAPAVELGLIGQLPDADGTAQPLSQMRKTIAKRLTQVWSATPHFYLTMAIDMEPAMARRKLINDELAAAGESVKLSVNDMIIKACALALKRFPRANSAFTPDGIVQFERVHIGVAVAVEDGLITPTVHDADKKSLSAIAAEVRDLASRARDKKLKPTEYGGSTFSVSNLGMYGIEQFQAIINPPEAAILACGAVEQVPVVKGGQLVVGTQMKVTLSCDHRALDGAVGAQFLQIVKKLLENPVLLMV